MQIAIDGLSVHFKNVDGSTLAALGSLSVTIDSGSFVALLGPSGCGKSTLIRAVAGLQQTTTGTVYIGNRLVTEPINEVVLMFQDANLMPWRTVRDNIALPLELNLVSKPERYQRVASLLPLLGLEDFAESYPSELSGGMAQRAALGRVLIQNPDVVLLDEPFGALDAMTREKISLDLLRLWARYQETVLMVTHDINEAVLLADRILILSHRPGQIIGDITVPLDRPRRLDMVYTQPFIETAREVRETIDRA
jgi:ABC-type nitrate/sulfonate/bicarbonate transport system ATPase subunit